MYLGPGLMNTPSQSAPHVKVDNLADNLADGKYLRGERGTGELLHFSPFGPLVRSTP